MHKYLVALYLSPWAIPPPFLSVDYSTSLLSLPISLPPSPLHLSTPQHIALLLTLNQHWEESRLGLLDGVHLGGDGPHLCHPGLAETVGVHAILEHESVGRVGYCLAVHARNVPPEVPGPVSWGDVLGIHHHWIHLWVWNWQLHPSLVELLIMQNPAPHTLIGPHTTTDISAQLNEAPKPCRINIIMLNTLQS